MRRIHWRDTSDIPFSCDCIANSSLQGNRFVFTHRCFSPYSQACPISAQEARVARKMVPWPMSRLDQRFNNDRASTRKHHDSKHKAQGPCGGLETLVKNVGKPLRQHCCTPDVHSGWVHTSASIAPEAQSHCGVRPLPKRLLSEGPGTGKLIGTS